MHGVTVSHVCVFVYARWNRLSIESQWGVCVCVCAGLCCAWSHRCVSVSVCVSAGMESALSHPEAYMCVCVCWYTMCIDSLVYFCVCAGVECTLSHSQPCV